MTGGSRRRFRSSPARLTSLGIGYYELDTTLAQPFGWRNYTGITQEPNFRGRHPKVLELKILISKGIKWCPGAGSVNLIVSITYGPVGQSNIPSFSKTFWHECPTGILRAEPREAKGRGNVMVLQIDAE